MVSVRNTRKHILIGLIITFTFLPFCIGADYDYEDVKTTSSGCTWIRNKLKNGRVKIRARGRIAKFFCNSRYEMVGKRFATCVHGKWNNPIPVCVTRGCPKMQEPRNGKLVDDLFGGGMLMYSCNPGYMLSGPSTLYCDGNQWDKTPPICAVVISQPQLSCDFEDPDLCGWNQDPNHDFDWKRNQFGTPSGHVGTGPVSDHTFGGSKGGFYLYLEASAPRKENDTARIFSSVYPSLDSPGCFVFWYHMYGATTGGLRIYVKPESHVFGELKPSWSKYGEQGNKWLRGNVTIPQLEENFQIIVEGIRGSSYVGDSAIDDVSLLQTDCNTLESVNITDDITGYSMDSCRGRCQELYLFGTFPCGCTDDCWANSTCCSDYTHICTERNTTAEDAAESAQDTTPIEKLIPALERTTHFQWENTVTTAKPQTVPIDVPSISSLSTVSKTTKIIIEPKTFLLTTPLPVKITSLPSTIPSTMKPTSTIFSSTYSTSTTLSSTSTTLTSTSTSLSSTTPKTVATKTIKPAAKFSTTKLPSRTTKLTTTKLPIRTTKLTTAELPITTARLTTTKLPITTTKSTTKLPIVTTKQATRTQVTTASMKSKLPVTLSPTSPPTSPPTFPPTSSSSLSTYGTTKTSFAPTSTKLATTAPQSTVTTASTILIPMITKLTTNLQMTTRNYQQNTTVESENQTGTNSTTKISTTPKEIPDSKSTQSPFSTPSKISSITLPIRFETTSLNVTGEGVTPIFTNDQGTVNVTYSSRYTQSLSLSSLVSITTARTTQNNPTTIFSTQRSTTQNVPYKPSVTKFTRSTQTTISTLSTEASTLPKATTKSPKMTSSFIFTTPKYLSFSKSTTRGIGLVSKGITRSNFEQTTRVNDRTAMVESDNRPSKSAAKPSTNSNTANVVGATFGIVLLIALVGGVAYIVLRRRKQTKGELSEDSEMIYLSANEVMEFSEPTALDKMLLS